MVDYEASLREVMKTIWCDYKITTKMDALCKKAIELANLSKDYEELHKILNYSRNTMHDGWIRRNPTVSITYKSKIFEFKENYPIEMSWAGLAFLIDELMIFWRDFVLASPIKDQTFIEHHNVKAFQLHTTNSK